MTSPPPNLYMQHYTLYCIFILGRGAILVMHASSNTMSPDICGRIFHHGLERLVLKIYRSNGLDTHCSLFAYPLLLVSYTLNKFVQLCFYSDYQAALGNNPTCPGYHIANSCIACGNWCDYSCGRINGCLGRIT